MMDTISRSINMCLLLILLLAGADIIAGWGESDKVILTDVKTLTLHHGQMTKARRSSPVPQLKCVGGSAGCNTFVPPVVQCYNRGSDGYDIQWECKTDMDNAYRFGTVEITCEGYAYPDDPYVLRGSCGLEYTIELTAEGHQKQNQKGHQYYQSNQGSYSSHHQNEQSSSFSNIVFFGIVILVIYGVYKCCLSSTTPGAGQQPGHHDDRYGGSQPPPYGFRSDNTSGYGMGGGCSPSAPPPYSEHNQYRTGTSTGTGGGGFWSGATMGGVLGYLFGNSGSRTYSGYDNSYYQQQPRRSFWNWGGSNWGSSPGYGSGGRTHTSTSYSSPSSSSFSSGTRTASGFGGTKRR